MVVLARSQFGTSKTVLLVLKQLLFPKALAIVRYGVWPKAPRGRTQQKRFRLQSPQARTAPPQPQSRPYLARLCWTAGLRVMVVTRQEAQQLVLVRQSAAMLL